MMVPGGLETAESVFQALARGLMGVSEMIQSGLCAVQNEERDRLMLRDRKGSRDKEKNRYCKDWPKIRHTVLL